MDDKTESAPPIRVIIVDDHKSIVCGLERLIESAEPRMMVAGTAESRAEMLDLVVKAKPDVILLDLDLNGDNAAEALPDLLNLTNGKVLILTGGRDSAILQTAILKGARGIISKNESAEVLLHAIARVHAGEIWLNRTLMTSIIEDMSALSSKKGHTDPEAQKITSLTQREREIIRAIVRSRGNKSQEIAESLHISEHNLRNHLTLIYEKLGLRNRIDLFAYSIEHGLADEED